MYLSSLRSILEFCYEIDEYTNSNKKMLAPIAANQAYILRGAILKPKRNKKTTGIVGQNNQRTLKDQLRISVSVLRVSLGNKGAKQTTPNIFIHRSIYLSVDLSIYLSIFIGKYINIYTNIQIYIYH